MATEKPETICMLWLDIETTGLDPNTCHILEIATIVTDLNLEILEEGPSIVVAQPSEVLDGMNEWCRDTHTRTGLLKESASSVNSLFDAERITGEFLDKYRGEQRLPMCGNSIAFDRAFLEVHMPSLAGSFHYRNIDVSTVKMLARYWYPDLSFKKEGGGNIWTVEGETHHRAIDDIRASIAELKLYRKAFFAGTQSANLRASVTEPKHYY